MDRCCLLPIANKKRHYHRHRQSVTLLPMAISRLSYIYSYQFRVRLFFPRHFRFVQVGVFVSTGACYGVSIAHDIYAGLCCQHVLSVTSGVFSLAFFYALFSHISLEKNILFSFITVFSLALRRILTIILDSPACTLGQPFSSLRQQSHVSHLWVRLGSPPRNKSCWSSFKKKLQPSRGQAAALPPPSFRKVATSPLKERM